MFGLPTRFRIFDLFDIPIYIDITLVFLLLFFGLNMLDCALMLLISITAHELGHALTARAFGYQTRDITLSLLGGCASLIALPRKPIQEFLTALAGPLVSFALSGISWLILNYVIVEVTPNNFWFFKIFYYTCYMNLMLGCFNLLPGFPLDGGRVFRSFMSSFMSRATATLIAMIVGRVVAVGIGLMGLYRICNGRNFGFVTLLIAWMIWKEGYREYLLSKMESSWTFRDYSGRVSPPPYGGESEDIDITRDGE